MCINTGRAPSHVSGQDLVNQSSEWISKQGPGSHSSVLGPSRHSPLAPTRLVKVDFGPSAYNLNFILLRIFHACTRILAFRIGRWGQRGAKFQKFHGLGGLQTSNIYFPQF